MISYCKKCLFPTTKPNLSFNDGGVCNACENYDDRSSIDWKSREKELEVILDKYRNKNGDNWDCIIPVSGGKDSTYQVLTMLKYNMNPLCVTATTCHLSDIGRRNIENIKSLGVDYIEFSPNKVVRKKLNRIGLEEVGDISWPEHVGIFTIPVRMAVSMKIPLLIWGENSQNEYGGPAAAAENNVLDRRWLEEFGGLLGMRVSDVVGQEGIEKKNMIPYTYPTDAELKEVGVTGLFLGHYIPWNGITNAMLAQANGFETYNQLVEGSAVDYENLDNLQTGIHDYFKFLKFGFGRATDLVNMQIRRGLLTREQGLDIVKKMDGKFPWTYLGVPLYDILEPIGISVDDFIKLCDQFTNKKLFKLDRNGKLCKDEHGNLIKINYDNVG